MDEELLLNFINEELESFPITVNSKLYSEKWKLNTRTEVNEI